jgi:hypothetical protein
MKRLLAAALVALLLAASSAQAVGYPPFKVEMGGNFYLRIYNPCCGGAQLGPWYQYWPLRAHFQTPAPVAYPYWPTRQTLPGGQAAYPFQVSPPTHPKAQAPKPRSPNVKPISYQPSVPDYWYGR